MLVVACGASAPTGSLGLELEDSPALVGTLDLELEDSPEVVGTLGLSVEDADEQVAAPGAPARVRAAGKKLHVGPPGLDPQRSAGGVGTLGLPLDGD